MESSRHKADNGERYRLYFGLLTRKVAEFEVDPENTYNMDEKGFMIGVIGKTKRVFDKVLYKNRRFKQASHNANREWTTVIGCICADGTTLPPAVIFSAAGDQVQSQLGTRYRPRDSFYILLGIPEWLDERRSRLCLA
jgi:hypothetical protein